MIKVSVISERKNKKKTEFPYYDDDLSDLKRQEKSNQRKAINKSAKAIASGNIYENEVDDIMILSEIEEIAKALDLHTLLNFIKQEGLNINPNLLKKINNVKSLRGIEQLMSNNTQFSTACKIVLEDD